MSKLKYFGRFRTARELLSAVKQAPCNDKFFNRDTMRFFGRQKFGIDYYKGDAFLVVRFLDHAPRITIYSIDADTLKLRHYSAPIKGTNV